MIPLLRIRSINRSLYLINNTLYNNIILSSSCYYTTINNHIKHLSSTLKQYVINNEKLKHQILDIIEELKIKVNNSSKLEKYINKCVAKILYQYFIDNNIIPNNHYILKETLLMFISCKMNKESILLYKEYFENKSSSIQVNNYIKDKFIKLYVNNNDYNMIYKLFKERIQEKSISEHTITTILKHFINNIKVNINHKSSLLEQVKQIHKDIINNNIPLSLQNNNQLINIYGSYGDIDKGIHIFNEMKQSNNIDIYTWKTILKVLYECNKHQQVIEYYQSMIKSKILPDEIIYTILLSTIKELKDLKLGKQIHRDIINDKILSIHLQNQLIDMYGSCGYINTAIQIFKKIKQLNKLSTWSYNIIIKALCENNKYKEAIKYYKSMITSIIQTDDITYITILSAIIKLGYYDLGYTIYNNIKDKEYMSSNIKLITKFMDFFGNFGDLEMSIKLFSKLKEISHSNNIPISIECWNTIIYVYGFNGKGKISYDLFKQMTNEYNCKPNDITILSLLNSFRNSKMIDEAIDIFNKLECNYNIIPNEKHYTLMIDILSRGGQLDKAEEYLNKCEFSDKEKEIAMTTLLEGCRKYSDYSRGIRIGDKLVKINPNDPSIYILLANICSDNGKQNEANKYYSFIKDKQLKKEPGITWITINGITNEFHAHEATHKQSKELFDKNINELEILKTKFGFKSNFINVPSQYKTIQEKEEYLCGHSERYALQYAHQNTPINKPIYATKNLRVCIDCHEWSLYISKLWNREIIVRDTNRLHIIKKGICSCNNYW